MKIIFSKNFPPSREIFEYAYNCISEYRINLNDEQAFIDEEKKIVVVIKRLPKNIYKVIEYHHFDVIINKNI